MMIATYAVCRYGQAATVATIASAIFAIPEVMHAKAT